VGAVAWSLLASPRAGLLNVIFRRLTGIGMELGPLNILSMSGLIWVMGLYYSPYAYIMTSGALRSLDSSMEEASRLCGASPARVLWHTTIPLVRPAILSAAFLIFSFSAGQFSIPQIIGIPARIDVLSTVIFAEAQTYPRDFSRLMGIGLMLLAIAAGALVLQRLWLRRGNYEVVAGKGTRSQLLDLGRWRYAVLGITVIYLLIVLVLPLLALAYSSFQRFSSTEFRPDLLTWTNYARVLSDRLTITSIANSLVLATVSASLCLTLGLVMSYMIHRTHLRGRGAINLLAMLPIGIPGIVLGTGILAAYISPPLVLYGTLGILVVGYVAHSLPTASQAAAAGLVQIGKELEESARVSGAPWGAMVRRILLPLLRPAMIGTWLLLFITQFRELDTSILLYTPGHEVVSVALLNLWEAGSYNPVAAFSVIVTLISLAVFILMQLVSGRRRVVLQD
ncbi:MAG TPA: iron ABC transporter permease, partial [Stellaceae bacterium]|nr:iron ABC transporter permease [Stellaceae bacterium]